MSIVPVTPQCMLSVSTGSDSNYTAHQIFEDPALYQGQPTLHQVLNMHSGSEVKKSASCSRFSSHFSVRVRISNRLMGNRSTSQHIGAPKTTVK